MSNCGSDVSSIPQVITKRNDKFWNHFSRTSLSSSIVMLIIMRTYSETEVVVGGGGLPPDCEEGVLNLETYSGLKHG